MVLLLIVLMIAVIVVVLGVEVGLLAVPTAASFAVLLALGC